MIDFEALTPADVPVTPFDVVLGGTAVDGDGDLSHDAAVVAGILARCPRTCAAVRVEAEVREDGR
ncbi:hypothetical protein [Nonomuraea sp. NPDC049400]|uniref:hypothetical protein n=1 Tax=Nonomuraea sp. NPDC049400 TaxID=3364352 RepID=UPI003788B4BE